MAIREDLTRALAAYELRFGEPLDFPPFDLGHVALSLEDFVEIARAAVRDGSPVDWSARYPALPPDAVS
jgi:hypothetical protein